MKPIGTPSSGPTQALPTDLDPGHEESAGPATRQLKSLITERDPFRYGGGDLLEVQRRAIAERFDQRREQITVLDSRARDLAITSIDDFADVVPLLFAHQTYKSYPDRFVLDGRWDLMNRWLSTLSVRPVTGVDTTGVVDVDGWIARLGEHGHYPLPSSGTTGKSSFLNCTAWDRELTQDHVIRSMRLTQGIETSRDRVMYFLGPNGGAHIFVGVMRKMAEHFGRPDATYWLSELVLSETAIQRLGVLRSRVNDGSATPGEIEELQSGMRARQQQTRDALGEIAEAMLRHRGEPAIIVGFWLPHFMLMEQARERGLGERALHPDSTIFVAGGLKGAKLPSDYEEQLARFHGVEYGRYHRNYGMVEMSTTFLHCDARRYHCPPWMIPLILDREGERLLNPSSGTVEGRMAFFDTAIEGRWGGLISGDRVVVDFTRCPCGRPSPSVMSIARYIDLEGDDKLTCAGTMASYVRGAIET